MTLAPFLQQISRALAQAGVPAMLTGSVASAFRGAMRATMDVDLVIDPTAARLERFVDHVEALGLYVSRDAARDAFAERTMFNVIDPESGWKADLIVCKARANWLGLPGLPSIRRTSPGGRSLSVSAMPGSTCSANSTLCRPLIQRAPARAPRDTPCPSAAARRRRGSCSLPAA